jgi:VanZ family protein
MWKIVAVIYFLFIAFLHLIPANTIPTISFADLFQLDKLVHLILFAGAYLVLVKALQQYSFSNKRLYLVLGCMFYGFLLEYLQSTLGQNRFGDVLDFVADTIGVFVGLFLSAKIAFVHTN